MHDAGIIVRCVQRINGLPCLFEKGVLPTWRTTKKRTRKLGLHECDLFTSAVCKCAVCPCIEGLTWIVVSFLLSSDRQSKNKNEDDNNNKNNNIKQQQIIITDTKRHQEDISMFGFLSRIHHYKCCVLTSVDVFPYYLHVLVPVGSALFVPESNHVTYLMHHHVMILTTRSNRYLPALIPRSAHCTVTTRYKKVPRKETWHFSACAVERLKILRNAIPGVNCRLEDWC